MSLLSLACPAKYPVCGANWYQGFGRDGYPAIYLNLGEGKPLLRTKPGDDGKIWTTVSAAVEQVRVRSERHNENIAALQAGLQRQEVTPEFLDNT